MRVEFPANLDACWKLKERYGIETSMVTDREERIPIDQL